MSIYAKQNPTKQTTPGSSCATGNSTLTTFVIRLSSTNPRIHQSVRRTQAGISARAGGKKVDFALKIRVGHPDVLNCPCPTFAAAYIGTGIGDSIGCDLERAEEWSPSPWKLVGADDKASRRAKTRPPGTIGSFTERNIRISSDGESAEDPRRQSCRFCCEKNARVNWNVSKEDSEADVL